jgi:hypothetical protein
VDRATRIDDNGRDRCVPVQAVSDSSDTIPTRDWFRSSVDQKGGSAPPPKQGDLSKSYRPCLRRSPVLIRVIRVQGFFSFRSASIAA